MGFTKKEAIAEHRKMWNWIANMIKQRGTVIDVERYKKNYCDNHGYGNSVENYCFLCEYVTANGIECKNCALIWGSHEEDECCQTFGRSIGLYSKVIHPETWQAQEKFARQIANLPEREDI